MQPFDHSRRHHLRGFTLVELVAVITIMGVVLAIAQPRIADYLQRDRVRRSAQRVVSDVRYVQASAMRLRTPTALRFSADDDAYTAWRFDPAAATPDWAPLDDPLRPGRQLVVQLSTLRDYQCTIAAADFGGSPTCVFDEYGQPAAAGAVSLVIRRLRVDIAVDAGTGRVSADNLYGLADEPDPPSDDGVIPADHKPGTDENVRPGADRPDGFVGDLDDGVDVDDLTITDATNGKPGVSVAGGGGGLVINLPL